MHAQRVIVSAFFGLLCVSSVAAQAPGQAQTVTPGAAGSAPATAATSSAAAESVPAAAPTTATAPATDAPVAAPTAPVAASPAAAPAAPPPAAPATQLAPSSAQAQLDAERPPVAEEPEERQTSNPKFGKPSVHDDVVGRWALGYFGVRSVPTADATDPDQSVPTPMLGARHWFNDTLGFEAAFGLGYKITGGETYVADGEKVNSPQTGVFAFSLHAGLPLSIYDGGSFNALVIPEVNLGVASGLEEAGVSASGLEEYPRGMMFSAGARAGAELHLDFIDLPQVVLQLTVGFGLQYETRTLETESTSGVVSGRTDGSVSISSDATSPLDWLAAGLQVLWYL